MGPLHFSENSILKTDGKVLFSHNGTYSSSCAYEINEAASIRLLLPRLFGAVSVSLHIFDENVYKEIAALNGYWNGMCDAFDQYDFDISVEKLDVGLYFLSFEINSSLGVIYGRKSGDRLVFVKSPAENDHFQLSISDFLYEKPQKKYGGIIYHIFVDRFNKGGDVKLKKNAVTDDDWRIIPEYPAYPGAPLKNNHFYGGTLWGVADKLGYIRSLGVNTIYLSPIFDAASNHKYDTADYMTVDSMFGGEEALRYLITKASEYGIGIILDGVFNHTGSDSIYFNKNGNYDSLGAFQSKESPYYSWYDFQLYPDKYTSWWGIDILPRINPDKPECRAYFTGTDGVIAKYAEMGIDGFRLDVVDELSDEFVSSVKSRLSKSNKASILYGEVWEDASNKISYNKRKHYYLGKELDGVMNYPIRKGIIEYLTTSDVSSILYALTDVIDNAPKRIRDLQMNLLGTHDTERILTVLSGVRAEGRSNDYLARKKMNDLERGIAKRRLRAAYTILATIPGIPTIFYGDEAGLEGYGDPFNRMPYPWGREDNKLVEFYKQIGALRCENKVYNEGEYRLLHLSDRYLSYERTDGNNAYVTFVNNTKLPLEIEFSSKASTLIGSSESDNNRFKIAEYSAAVFKTSVGSNLSF